jgi:hypothetical protein
MGRETDKASVPTDMVLFFKQKKPHSQEGELWGDGLWVFLWR